MGQYNQAVITTAGQGLLAGVIASGKALAFTNAKTSTHIYPSGLEALTDITDVMQTDAVSSATVMSNTQVKISTRFTNEGITAAYDINTIGIFAKAEGDTTDTLFAVITAVTPDAMPKYTTTNPVAYIYDITVGMSNADSITLNVSPTGTPSYGDLAAAQTAAENASAANLAPAYDSTATYAKDDFCVNGGKLYQCNADISTAEAFNPAHWTEVKVTEVMGGGGGVTPEIMAQIENAQWKSEGEVTLFDESVTTAAQGNFFVGNLVYSKKLPADTLKVTFNGVEYTCPKIAMGEDSNAYGGIGESGPDFTEFPFAIICYYDGEEANSEIYTPSAGTYSVSASATGIVPTDEFKIAVRSANIEKVSDVNSADVAVVHITDAITATSIICTIEESGATFSTEQNTLNEDFYVFHRSRLDSSANDLFTCGMMSLSYADRTAEWQILKYDTSALTSNSAALRNTLVFGPIANSQITFYRTGISEILGLGSDDGN